MSLLFSLEDYKSSEGGSVEKKIKHKKKIRFSKLKKNERSDSPLTHKSDEDGVLIFQFDYLKPSWILKKIKSHFGVDNKNNEEECKAWGLKV